MFHPLFDLNGDGEQSPAEMALEYMMFLAVTGEDEEPPEDEELGEDEEEETY